MDFGRTQDPALSTTIDPHPAAHDAPPRCASCDAPLSGSYCAACGERRLGPREHSLRRFLVENLGEIANVDAKLYRSLRALALQPGRLTREYMAGRRVHFIRPIQLFLIANLVYFVVQAHTLYSGYNTPLSLQMRGQVYSEPANLGQRVTLRAQERGMTLDTYARVYDAKSEIFAKSLVLLMVPLLAGVFALLAWRRRSFVEHVVFTTHYLAWELLFMSSLFLFLYGRALYPAIISGLQAMGVDLAAAIGTPAGSVLWFFVGEFPTFPLEVAYLGIAFRRVYGHSRAGALTRALLAVPAVFAVILVYRFLLFWVTFASI